MKACLGIYVIKCLPTGKCYVGSALNCRSRTKTHKTRLKRGIHINKHLQAAWNKYGPDAFTFEVLEICKSENELVEREQWWINKLQSGKSKFGFNIAAAVRQEMPAEQLSFILKDYWASLTPEERDAREAYKHTEEGRVRLQQNALAQWADPEFRETMPLKVSATMKELCAAPEAVTRLTAISNLYWSSPEAKAKMSTRMLKQWSVMTKEQRRARVKNFIRPRETTRFFTLNNVTKSLKEWSQESGLPYGLLLRRLVDGYSADKMFAATYRHKPKDSFVLPTSTST